jgi:hypothetical protein
VRRITIDERRARLGARHGLATGAKAKTPADAARAVVALHSTDPASVFLATYARMPRVTVREIEDALYADRSLVRMLGMRRTMFVVSADMVPVIHASSTKAIAAAWRRRYGQLLEAAGVGDATFLKEVEEATLRALVKRGEATGAQLSTDEPRLRTQVETAESKAYGRRQNITTWVLFQLAADGRIVRGRPLGSWTSSQYHWSPTETWLPGGVPELAVDEARVELVRRWLAAFGPATTADLKWWTGWTATEVKKALTAIGPAEVNLDGVTGIALPDDLETTPKPKPWVALLPALDPTAMGWSQRAWYLGEHAAALFDRSGNVGPTVWSDGRIVGGWAQRPSGEVVYRLLEDIGRDKAAGVERAAGKLAQWIGPVRVTPRFRTPLEKELSA